MLPAVTDEGGGHKAGQLQSSQRVKPRQKQPHDHPDNETHKQLPPGQRACQDNEQQVMDSLRLQIPLFRDCQRSKKKKKKRPKKKKKKTKSHKRRSIHAGNTHTHTHAHTHTHTHTHTPTTKIRLYRLCSRKLWVLSLIHI